jgi:hypothetical protein
MKDVYPLSEILLRIGGNAIKEKKREVLWDNSRYIYEERFEGTRYLSGGWQFFSRKIRRAPNDCIVGGLDVC